MNRTTITVAAVLWVLLLSASPLPAAPSITAGTWYLLPNTQKTIPITVSTSALSTDMVRMLDLFIQVGDGGPINSNPQTQGTDTVPTITNVDVIGPGTLFYQPSGTQSTYHLPDTGGSYLIWNAATELPGQTSRAASGTLGWVTIDTSGAPLGLSRALSLNGVATCYLNDPAYPNGFTTSFGGAGDATISNGQIIIVSLHTMTWSGTAGNWSDTTWTGQMPPFPNYTADVAVNNTGTVTIDAPQEANSLAIGNGSVVAITSTGTLQSAAGVTLNSGGTLSIGSNDHLSASTALSFSGGVLQVTGTSVSNLGSRPVNWSTFDGGFDISSSANAFTVNQTISGSGSLAKNGPGTLVLMGSNTYAGDTTVDAGTLKALALSSTSSTITVGGDLAQTATLAANYIHVHKLVINPGSTVILGGVSAAAAAVDPGGNVASSYAVGSLDAGAATVPEPSTFALLGAGAIAMLAYACRRRKRSA